MVSIAGGRRYAQRVRCLLGCRRNDLSCLRPVKTGQFLLLVGLLAASFAHGQGPSAVDAVGGQQGSAVVAVGTIRGTVTDADEGVVAGAQVTLVTGAGADRRAVTDNDGRFEFVGAPAGAFRLTVTADGLARGLAAGVLHGGEELEMPRIALPVGSTTSEIQVFASVHEVAEAEVKEEEKQKVMGFIPNFYVTYNWHPAPLTSKQKYELGWRTIVDPGNLVVNAGVAGVQQWQNSFPGYGQGGLGYAKRYAAVYGDFIVGTMIGGAILPSVLHQDPRYIYKGTGTVKSRALYALAAAVICRGDNGKWQPNYSSVLGDLAAGGISNLYYPKSSRNGAGLTIENGLLGTVSDGVSKRDSGVPDPTADAAPSGGEFGESLSPDSPDFRSRGGLRGRG
jgi:hypothetical protein